MATYTANASLSGAGALSSEGTFPAWLSGTGSLVLDAVPVVVADMRLSVLDDTLIQAPTAVTVMVMNGWADQTVDFDIDGTVVYSDTLDADGNLGPISIAVSEALGAKGAHTITVTGTGTGQTTAASSTFTISKGPNLNPRIVGPDADPVAVAGAVSSTGVHRWVLQDLLPGGLGSWIMPRNPVGMDPLPITRTVDQQHSTAIDGKFHLTDAGSEALEWRFTGYLDDQATADQLVTYGDLNRRFYVIDHRNRAWTVTFISVEIVPRKRQLNNDGTFNDWAADYTVTALLYDRDWKTPQ